MSSSVTVNYTDSTEIENAFGKELRKSRVGFKVADIDTVYLGAFDESGALVGCVGYLLMGRFIRYKTDYVKEELRGKGVYSLLWRAREKVLESSDNERTAFCTEMSLPKYLKEGFAEQREKKDGIAFVKR